MVKNTVGGNKTKKKKRSRVVDIYNTENEGQYFGKIMKNVGGHFMVLGLDKVERIGKLRNAMKRGPRINLDTFVIYSLREFSDKNECDVIGIANPPDDVIKQFDGMNPKKKNLDIDFKDQNDEFSNIDKVVIEDKKILEDNYCDSLMPDYESDYDKNYEHDYDYKNKLKLHDNEKTEDITNDDYENYNNLMNKDDNFDDFDDLDNFGDDINNDDSVVNICDVGRVGKVKISDFKLNKHDEKKRKEEEFNNLLEEVEKMNLDDIDFDDL